MTFTHPIDPKTADDLRSYKMNTFTYIYRADYGSPVVDPTTPELTKVEVVNKGGWFRPDIRLVVNGRDRTKLVDGVHRQRAQVRDAIAGTAFADAPVHGALCFVDSEWPWFAKPKTVDGIVVSWGAALQPMLTEAGEFDEGLRATIHRHLAEALPPK